VERGQNAREKGRVAKKGSFLGSALCAVTVPSSSSLPTLINYLIVSVPPPRLIVGGKEANVGGKSIIPSPSRSYTTFFP
jgi:hypothetical protein